MAIGAPASITQGTNTTDATSQTTAAISPANGSLVVACLAWTKATTPDAFTITDTGTNTWSSLGVTSYNSSGTPTKKIGASWAIWNGSVASTITWDFAGNTQTSFLWTILEITGTHLTTPFVAANLNAGIDNANVTTITRTYPQAFASGSIGLLICGVAATVSAPVGSGSWTNIASTLQNVATPTNSLFAQTVTSDPVTGVPTWTGAGACGARIYEIQPPAAVGGGGGLVGVTAGGVGLARRPYML